MKRLTIALVATGLLLTGCASDGNGGNNPDRFFVNYVDGTRCIVWIGDNQRSAMQCDFGHQGSR